MTSASAVLAATNPILPSKNEMIWGLLSFLALLWALNKWGYPQVKKGMDNRTKKIRDSLDDAERTREEARKILRDYQKQLSDAKEESSRIIEEARQSADRLRQDLKRQAEDEVTEIKNQAQEDISNQLERAKAELQATVAELSIDLAEKVVERSLDRETNMAMIENFIRQTGSNS